MRRILTNATNVDVLYEDNHLIAVNKRAGDIVQGDKTADLPLGEYIKQYIKQKYNKPGNVYLGVVHRLDRPVTGVVLFAKTSKALERMNQLFRARKIEKIYWAITAQRPKFEEGTITHYLTRIPSKNLTIAHRNPVLNSQKAKLRYELIGKLGNHNLIQVFPHTGRQHQIRVQLARLACPIRGDKKYGAIKYNKDRSIHLHARSLSFIHPTTKVPITITAHPPIKDDVWRMFREMF